MIEAKPSAEEGSLASSDSATVAELDAQLDDLYIQTYELLDEYMERQSANQVALARAYLALSEARTVASYRRIGPDQYDMRTRATKMIQISDAEGCEDVEGLARQGGALPRIELVAAHLVADAEQCKVDQKSAEGLPGTLTRRRRQRQPHGESSSTDKDDNESNDAGQKSDDMDSEGDQSGDAGRIRNKTPSTPVKKSAAVTQRDPLNWVRIQQLLRRINEVKAKLQTK
ncbi:hypothetical protein EV182_005352, partial [Spiromyces aspiralis]